MSLSPSPADIVARALGDLRLGLPIGVPGHIALSVETLTQARLNALQAVGPVSLALTDWRARTLKTPVYDGDVTRLCVPAGVDRAWLRAMADPSDDLTWPLKGPFVPDRAGGAGSARIAVTLAKAAQLLPAMVLAQTDTFPPGVTFVPSFEPSLDTLRAVIGARVPLKAAPQSRVHVHRPDHGGAEHYAIEIGSPDRDAPVLCRLHSACFTGDVLGSLKCDCGPQLDAALAQMGHEGAGILLYLNQEGRGIGLANKLRAYALQDQGYDTVEANHRLGFEDDERDFRIGATILKNMGVTQLRLLTNNPYKVARMEAMGLTVAERVPLHVGQTAENAGYLATKRDKSGHLL